VFSVVDRRQLDAIRSELNFQWSGEVSNASAQEIGQMLGAQTIVSGSITTVGSEYRIQVRAILVQTAAVQGLTTKSVSSKGPVVTALTTASAASAVSSGGRTSAGTQAAQPEPAAYRIGDTGPAGGTVFSTGNKRLECSGDLGQVPWADAEKLAKGCKTGNKSDWRMPTKDELNAMYNNLKKSNKGGFKSESYWGKNGNSAYALNFGGGNDNNSPTVTEKKWVRAVRSF